MFKKTKMFLQNFVQSSSHHPSVDKSPFSWWEAAARLLLRKLESAKSVHEFQLAKRLGHGVQSSTEGLCSSKTSICQKCSLWLWCGEKTKRKTGITVNRVLKKVPNCIRSVNVDNLKTTVNAFLGSGKQRQSNFVYLILKKAKNVIKNPGNTKQLPVKEVGNSGNNVCKKILVKLKEI